MTRLAVLGALCLTLTTPALAEPPAVRTAITGNDYSHRTCLRRAERAVRDAGFRRIDVDRNDVEAENGDYTTETICLRNEIVVIVAGPSSRVAGRLRDRIANGIR